MRGERWVEEGEGHAWRPLLFFCAEWGLTLALRGLTAHLSTNASTFCGLSMGIGGAAAKV